MTGHNKSQNRYGSLAAMAHAAGFASVTARQIHLWCERGLLPPAIISYTGFGKREIHEPPGIDAQLNALCHARFQLGIRNHELLGAWLWAEGFGISTSIVRKGLGRLLEAVPAYLRRYRRGQDAPDALDDLALESAKSIPLPPGQPRNVALLHQGLFEALSRQAHVGVEAEPDLDGLRHLADLIGLARARTDRIGAAEPWLTEDPGIAVLDGLAGTSIDRLGAALAGSDDQQLGKALALAQELHKRWSVLGEMIQLGFGADFAGLRVMSDGLRMPMGLPLATLVILSLPEQTESFLAALPSGEELASIVEAIDQLKTAMAADPALANRVATMGAMAVLGVDEPIP